MEYMNITGLKVGPKVGDRFDDTITNNSDIGHYFHDIYKEYFEVQDGKGSDVPGMFEIKSKEAGKNNSPWSIGSMHEQDIISTKYKDTNICDKLQVHLQIQYTKNPNIIKTITIVNFTDKFTQEKLEKDYNEIANKILALPQDYNKAWERVFGTYMHAERIDDSDHWKFRLTTTQMKMLKNAKRFGDLFTEVG